jgi:hypothetical protein
VATAASLRHRLATQGVWSPAGPARRARAAKNRLAASVAVGTF